jgi:hypothetical protein
MKKSLKKSGSGSRILKLRTSNSVKINNPSIKRSDVIMKRIGLDIGTKHIVLAYLDENNNRKVRYEVNGYLSFPRGDNFMEQLLLNQKIPFVTREDGKGNKEFIAIGKMAEQLAYSLNRTLCRPMAEGGISKYDEDAQEVIAIIIKSIIGKLTEDTIIYYCTTAKPINNQNLNVDFHRKQVRFLWRFRVPYHIIGVFLNPIPHPSISDGESNRDRPHTV